MDAKKNTSERLNHVKRETLQNIPSLTDSGSLEVSLKRNSTGAFGQPELMKRISNESANASFPSTSELPLGSTMALSLKNQTLVMNKIDLSKPLDVIDESREEQQNSHVPKGSEFLSLKQSIHPLGHLR